MGFYITDQTQDRGPRAAAHPWGPKPARGPIREVISGYRFYNPELGRWINRDPIGEEGGFNIYAFVKNNPFIGVDILGKDSFSINFEGDSYSVSGMGFSGTIDKNGGAITWTPDYFNLSNIVGDWLFAIGNVTVSGGGNVNVTRTSLSREACKNSYRPEAGGLSASISWPLRLSITGGLSLGSTVSTELTYFLNASNWIIIAPSHGLEVATSLDMLWFAEEFCTCYKLSGSLDLTAELTANLGGLGIAALVPVAVPSLIEYMQGAALATPLKLATATGL